MLEHCVLIHKDENHDGKDEIQNAKHEETLQEKGQNNLMRSFTEKALSVAAPVVPTKSDGEVDQEKYVNVTVFSPFPLSIFSLFSVNALIMF